MSAPAKIAILGGAGGIGRQLIKELKDAGQNPVVLDLAPSLERHDLCQGGIAIDVTNQKSVTAAFAQLAKLGPLSGFVNLAGYNTELVPLAKTSATYFDEILSANLRGAFLAAQAALPLLHGKNASLVHVSSGLAQNVRPGYGAYSASKAAVIAMTKTLAQENAPRVRVNAVAPGLVDTAFLRGGTGRSDETSDSIVNLKAYQDATPMGRIALPADITGPIRFLLGQDSGFMTGQVLWVNGGGYMP